MDVSDVFTNERDHRTYYQEKVILCMILLSTAFERTAYYSLAANFTPSLRLWSSDPCSSNIVGSLIFSSKYIIIV